MRKWFFVTFLGLFCVATMTMADGSDNPNRWNSCNVYHFVAAGGVRDSITNAGHSGTAWETRVLIRGSNAGVADSARITLLPVSGDQDSVPIAFTKYLECGPMLYDFNIPSSDIRVVTYSGNTHVSIFVKD